MAISEEREPRRPLSPHLQIYRLPLTAKLSITHRMTGVALGAGLLLVLWWFTALAVSPRYFALVDGILSSTFGGLVLLAAAWAFWFHFLNGLRHLVWDTGRGIENRAAERSAWAVIALSLLLTVITALVA